MPVDWPVGTFGLPKPKSGCPDKNQTIRWLEGWLEQKAETQDPDSEWNSHHLEGKKMLLHSSIKLYFNASNNITV